MFVTLDSVLCLFFQVDALYYHLQMTIAINENQIQTNKMLRKSTYKLWTSILFYYVMFIHAKVM